ncbi:sensor histidine kinase [Algoriphagus namhaensis]
MTKDQYKESIKLHELRTPLFGIQSTLEYILDQLDQLDQDMIQELLGKVLLSCKRMDNSLIKLQRWATLDKGSDEPESYLSCQKLLEKKIGSKPNFKLGVIRDFKLVFREDQLSFLLDELVENASKFHSSKEPIQVILDVNQLIILNHQNNLNPTQVFHPEPFFQINRPIREQQGLGLGLAICQAYARQNNTELTFQISKGIFRAVLKSC